MTFHRRKGEDWHDWHDRYIKSAEWRQKANAVLRRYSFRCALNLDLKPDTCEGVIDVHHRTYERLGNEANYDLVPLCRKHHEALHLEIRKAKSKPKKRGKRGIFSNDWF